MHSCQEELLITEKIQHQLDSILVSSSVHLSPNPYSAARPYSEAESYYQGCLAKDAHCSCPQATPLLRTMACPLSSAVLQVGAWPCHVTWYSKEEFSHHF